MGSESGDLGEGGGRDGLVDLGDPLVGLGGDGVVGVGGDGLGAAEGVVGADGGVHAGRVLDLGEGGGREGEDDEGNLNRMRTLTH